METLISLHMDVDAFEWSKPFLGCLIKRFTNNLIEICMYMTVDIYPNMAIDK